MAALGAIGSLVGMFASVQQLQYQAAIADANKKQLEFNARAASEAGGIDAMDIGRQGAAEAGTLLSNQGASGLAISSPSFGTGLTAFLGRAYQTAQRRVSQGNQQSAGFQTQANIEGANAQGARAAIPFTILGGIFNAASSFVGGAMPTSFGFGGGGGGTVASTPVPATPMSGASLPWPYARPRLRGLSPYPAG